MKMSKVYQRNFKKINKDYQRGFWKTSNLSKEEKEKKQQYGCERYKNLSGNEKQKLEYRKRYCYMRKNTLL